MRYAYFFIGFILVQCLIYLPVLAQQVPFTQYQLASTYTNPALAAIQQQFALSGNYRHQTTQAGISLKSVLLNSWHPFYASKKNGPTAAFGLTALDDRSANGGYRYQTLGGGLAYAVGLNEEQRLAFGLQTAYSHRFYDATNFTTGMQFSQERGFDPSLPNGEDLSRLRSHYLSWNVGISWLRQDKREQPIGFAGLAVHNFNQPSEQFLSQTLPVKPTLQAYAAYRVYEGRQFGIFPELLLTQHTGYTQPQLGSFIRYAIDRLRPRKGTLQLGARYRLQQGISLLGKLEQEGYEVGLSYDITTSREANTPFLHTLELGFKVYRQVKGKYRRRNKRNSPAPNIKEGLSPRALRLARPKTPVAAQKKSWLKLDVAVKQTNELLAQRIHFPVPVQGQVEVGKENKAFNFATNSATIHPADKPYLDELAIHLKTHPKEKLYVFGHTDDLGSPAYNRQLSERRARAIARYLVRQGIERFRIISLGLGETKPLVPNDSEAGRALNRRVEFILYQ